MSKILVVTDPHCGSTAGLTPPEFFHKDLEAIEVPFWEWYSTTVPAHGPYDMLIALGDLTDGEGKKGTLDTSITDPRKQAHAAALVLKVANVPTDKIFIVRGTPFHSSGVTEYEDMIREYLPGVSIKNTQRLCVNGKRIHSRHVIGRSDTNYGQATPLMKEISRLESEAFRQSKDAPDVILRGHVHYESSAGKHGRISIACPCLQLPLSESNGRRYSAFEYDVGIGVLTIERDRPVIWEPFIMDLRIVKDDDYVEVIA